MSPCGLASVAAIFAVTLLVERPAGGRQAELGFDAANDRVGGFQRRAEKPLRAGEIDETFVNGKSVNFRRVLRQDGKNFAGEIHVGAPAVAVEKCPGDKVFSLGNPASPNARRICAPHKKPR